MFLPSLSINLLKGAKNMDEQISEERKEELIKEFSKPHKTSELFDNGHTDTTDVGELAQEIGQEIWEVL